MADPRDAAQETTDRAQRCSDAVTLALLGQGRGVVGKWLAVRLSDGGTDGNVYDRKADAVRHQLHPQQCAYVCIPPDGMGPRSARIYLRFVQGLYAAGYDIADPDQHVQLPAQREGIAPALRHLRRGR